jgi:hypothetical protein
VPRQIKKDVGQLPQVPGQVGQIKKDAHYTHIKHETFIENSKCNSETYDVNWNFKISFEDTDA